MTNAPRIFEVDRLDCRLVPHHWDFAQARAAEIDRRWAERLRENPALYDGPVLLACRAEIVLEGDRRALQLDAFETRFSRFLVWRDFGWPDKGVFNCFAMPAVRASDGAFLVGEMAPGHSSAGQLYFPGGTPDLSDVTECGRVDLAGSLVRELEEETGLSAVEGVAAPEWTVIFDAQRIACIRQLHWPAPGRAICERVRAFIAAEAAPELSDAHMLGPGPHTDPRLPPFMVDYLAHAAKFPG